MQAIISGDREAFLAREVETRQRGLLPPYGRLAALVVSPLIVGAIALAQPR